MAMAGRANTRMASSRSPLVMRSIAMAAGVSFQGLIPHATFMAAKEIVFEPL